MLHCKLIATKDELKILQRLKFFPHKRGEKRYSVTENFVIKTS